MRPHGGRCGVQANFLPGSDGRHLPSLHHKGSPVPQIGTGQGQHGEHSQAAMRAGNRASMRSVLAGARPKPRRMDHGHGPADRLQGGSPKHFPTASGFPHDAVRSPRGPAVAEILDALPVVG